MNTEITARNAGVTLPVDSAGLTPPLRTLLGSSELTKHRAMVAVELEVLARKFDRFGWDRDRGSASQDRLIVDWVEALCDFPLSEIRSACRRAVQENPNRMPNEGHILQRIIATRAEIRRMAPKPSCDHPSQMNRPAVERRAEAARIMAEVYGALRMGQGDQA